MPRVSLDRAILARSGFCILNGITQMLMVHGTIAESKHAAPSAMSRSKIAIEGIGWA